MANRPSATAQPERAGKRRRGEPEPTLEYVTEKYAAESYAAEKYAAPAEPDPNTRYWWDIPEEREEDTASASSGLRSRERLSDTDTRTSTSFTTTTTMTGSGGRPSTSSIASMDLEQWLTPGARFSLDAALGEPPLPEPTPDQLDAYKLRVDTPFGDASDMILMTPHLPGGPSRVFRPSEVLAQPLPPRRTVLAGESKNESQYYAFLEDVSLAAHLQSPSSRETEELFRRGNVDLYDNATALRAWELRMPPQKIGLQRHGITEQEFRRNLRKAALAIARVLKLELDDSSTELLAEGPESDMNEADYYTHVMALYVELLEEVQSIYNDRQIMAALLRNNAAFEEQLAAATRDFGEVLDILVDMPLNPVDLDTELLFRLEQNQEQLDLSDMILTRLVSNRSAAATSTLARLINRLLYPAYRTPLVFDATFLVTVASQMPGFAVPLGRQLRDVFDRAGERLFQRIVEDQYHSATWPIMVGFLVTTGAEPSHGCLQNAVLQCDYDLVRAMLRYSNVTWHSFAERNFKAYTMLNTMLERFHAMFRAATALAAPLPPADAKRSKQLLLETGNAIKLYAGEKLEELPEDDPRLIEARRLASYTPLDDAVEFLVTMMLGQRYPPLRQILEQPAIGVPRDDDNVPHKKRSFLRFGPAQARIGRKNDKPVPLHLVLEYVEAFVDFVIFLAHIDDARSANVHYGVLFYETLRRRLEQVRTELLTGRQGLSDARIEAFGHWVPRTLDAMTLFHYSDGPDDTMLIDFEGHPRYATMLDSVRASTLFYPAVQKKQTCVLHAVADYLFRASLAANEKQTKHQHRYNYLGKNAIKQRIPRVLGFIAGTSGVWPVLESRVFYPYWRATLQAKGHGADIVLYDDTRITEFRNTAKYAPIHLVPDTAGDRDRRIVDPAYYQLDYLDYLQHVDDPGYEQSVITGDITSYDDPAELRTHAIMARRKHRSVRPSGIEAVNPNLSRIGGLDVGATDPSSSTSTTQTQTSPNPKRRRRASPSS